MVERTLVIVGPGGVGKTPLGKLIRDAVIQIDPYRLREKKHPRNEDDSLYAHPKLRCGLDRVATSFGDEPRDIGDVGCIRWYPKSQMLSFKVREDWQLLILKGLAGELAKAEIFAPILNVLLEVKEIRCLFGELCIVVLNPLPQSICDMSDWRPLAEKTGENRLKRGDTCESAISGAVSVFEEGPAWRELIEERSAIEYRDWPFPEYVYKTPPAGVSLEAHQKQVGDAAVRCLLEGRPDLAVFFA